MTSARSGTHACGPTFGEDESALHQAEDQQPGCSSEDPEQRPDTPVLGAEDEVDDRLVQCGDRNRRWDPEQVGNADRVPKARWTPS